MYVHVCMYAYMCVYKYLCICMQYIIFTQLKIAENHEDFLVLLVFIKLRYLRDKAAVTWNVSSFLCSESIVQLVLSFVHVLPGLYFEYRL